MKIKLILYIFLCLLFFFKKVYADQIFFDSDNLIIKEEGNMIFATKGFAKIPSKNIEIEGDKFIYNKLISELTIIDNVKYFDNQKKVYIESEKLIYDEINNNIFSEGKTFIKIEEKYKVNSSNILYDRNYMKISSKKFTTVDDAIKINLNLKMVFYLRQLKKLFLQKKLV